MTYTLNDVREAMLRVARGCRAMGADADDMARDCHHTDSMRAWHYHEGKRDAFNEVAERLEGVASDMQNRRVSK